MNEVATELGCDWHTVNDAVIAYGTALVEDPGRFGDVNALGLDEVLFVRRGQWHHKEFTTQLVDVEHSQLLDIVEGRGAEDPKRWITERSERGDATFASAPSTSRAPIAACSLQRSRTPP